MTPAGIQATGLSLKNPDNHWWQITMRSFQVVEEAFYHLTRQKETTLSGDDHLGAVRTHDVGLLQREAVIGQGTRLPLAIEFLR